MLTRWLLRTLLAGLCLTGAWAAVAADADADPALLKRGEYLARAADCNACHSVPHGEPFAGGLAIQSPVGTIFASNITPSASFGIGGTTERQFADALRRGIRADGSNLYPAMPYTSYALFSDADVHALYGYFMHAVKPVDKPAPPTRLPFPMNFRASMKVWNWLFLDTKPFKPDPQQSEAWNRGAYLVEGAAHCGACHTPRGFLMQELAGRQFAGGLVGAWYAPNITADVDSGIGSWTGDELVQYLRTGRLRGKAQAAGGMGEAVEHSLQYLTDADLAAIATYVRAIPAIHDPADKTSRFAQGRPFSPLDAVRGTAAIASDSEHPTGAELFLGSCASCHSAQAQGSRDSYYPSLFDNSALVIDHGNNLIATILHGVNRTTQAGQAFMPGFGGNPADADPLSDRQIATLANYVLAHYGQGETSISEEQVADVRRGGPSSLLVPLAQAGVAAGALAVVVILLLGLLLVRRKRRSRQPLSRGPSTGALSEAPTGIGAKPPAVAEVYSSVADK
jgi:mono/diheme cytochrome c family protein